MFFMTAIDMGKDSVEITDYGEFVTRADIPDEIEGMPGNEDKRFCICILFWSNRDKYTGQCYFYR